SRLPLNDRSGYGFRHGPRARVATTHTLYGGLHMIGGESLEFEIRPNPAPVSAAERASLLTNPGFGRVFTDHMVTVRYADGKGWYDEARSAADTGAGFGRISKDRKSTRLNYTH